MLTNNSTISIKNNCKNLVYFAVSQNSRNKDIRL